MANSLSHSAQPLMSKLVPQSNSVEAEFTRHQNWLSERGKVGNEIEAVSGRDKIMCDHSKQNPMSNITNCWRVDLVARHSVRIGPKSGHYCVRGDQKSLLSLYINLSL